MDDNVKIFFRSVTVSEVIFHDLSDKGEVVFRPSDGFEVIVRALTEEEVKSVNIHFMGGYAVTVDAERDVPRKARRVFETLVRRRLPEGMKIQEENREFFNEDGTIKEQFYENGGLRLEMPLQNFDNAFQTFVTTVTKELQDYTNNFIKVLRWRGNGSGPNETVKATRRPVWSFDKKTWHLLPQRREATVFQHTSMLHTTDDVKADVEWYIKDGVKESLAHELLYEAWSQRGQSPRSALVLSIAAVEVGLKQCIILLAPHSEWFLKTFQSPPVVKILQEYLPTLPAKHKIKDKVLPPDSQTLDDLKKGVKLRNEAVHSIPQGLTQETLREILLAVQDTLWLLEYYSGYQWALQYVSSATISRMEYQNTNLMEAARRR